MKKGLLYLLAFFTVVQAFAQSGNDSAFVANELYVKLKFNQPQNLVQYIPHPDNPDAVKQVWSIIQAHNGVSMISPFKGKLNSTKNLYKVKLKEGADMSELLDELNHNPNIEYAQRIPVYYIQFKPVELDEEKQWYFRTINMDASWSSRITNEKTIAIIDNGVRYTHEDLFSRIAWNIDPHNPDKSEIPNDGIDNDGNGYIDDYFGWDVADNDPDPAPIPRPRNLPLSINPQFGWHGTHVAGIVAASADNGLGIASLGINNRIVCIKAASSKANSEGKVDDLSLPYIVEAFEYAIERKVDIINCSFSTTIYDKAVEDIIRDARKQGIIVVAAAGNIKNNSSPTKYYPAAYDGVIGVGATDKDDHISDFSNYGDDIDVMAPGDNIYSTLASGDQGYGYMSGTSMAAPIVSGLIGLILSSEPDRVGDIEAILKGGCDNIDWKNPSYTGKMGAGRINVDRSFEYMINEASSVAKVNYTDIKVYPNPASGEVFIPFETLSTNGQPINITILNSIGAQVAIQEVSNNQQTISVANLPQGIYQIVIASVVGQNYRARLLVNR